MSRAQRERQVTIWVDKDLFERFTHKLYAEQPEPRMRRRGDARIVDKLRALIESYTGGGGG